MTKHIALNEYLVAFVDLLGFSIEVQNIKNNDDLQIVFQKIKKVHDIFGKNPIDDFERKERDLSERCVLSLSDSVIIATALKSPVSDTMGVFDNWCCEVHTIGINQAICAANGIFLRGGLSKGQFNFEDDILISKAMITAYETEKKDSKYPLICLDKVTHKWFNLNSGNDCYSDEINPKNTLFKSFKDVDGTIRIAIDYIGIGISAASEEFTFEDQKEYQNALEDEKDTVRDNIAKRHALKFADKHKSAIQNELEKKHKKCVEEKYLWLKKYHNDTIRNCFPSHHELLIL